MRDGNDGKIDVTKVDVSMNGIELQDREFVAAIREGREPNASVAQVLPAYRALAALEKTLAESHGEQVHSSKDGQRYRCSRITTAQMWEFLER